jgi:hypothetical protein
MPESNESSFESSFESVANKGKRPNAFSELTAFIRYTKRWYLIPIMVALLVFSLFIILGGTGLAPFIYTLF